MFVLSRLARRVRHETVTTEILDLIGGAEALFNSEKTNAVNCAQRSRRNLPP